MAALATYAEEIPEPVLEMVELDLTSAKPIALALPIEIKVPAPVESAEAASPEPAAEMAKAAPAPPPVLANPLAPPSAITTQRRARIAVPR